MNILKKLFTKEEKDFEDIMCTNSYETTVDIKGHRVTLRQGDVVRAWKNGCYELIAREFNH